MSETSDSQDTKQTATGPRHRDRRVLHAETLSKADKKKLEKRNKSLLDLAEIEHEVQQLLVIKAQNQGTLRGTGARKEAAARLGVAVETIDNYVERYEKTASRDVFIGAEPGRPSGQGFTPDQEAVITFLYYSPEGKTIFINDLEVASTPYRPTAQYIHEVLQLVCPDPPKSVHQVRRHLEKLKKDNPTVDLLVQRGERYLREKVVPKPRNDVLLPNMRWQLDGRPLPIYIKHDGIICTVSLLLVMDDFSTFALRARLIPRVLRDEKGIPKRAEFNKNDVGILIASTMFHLNICPADLYTDNGGQIVTVGKLLNNLRRQGELLAEFTRSIPGRPQGRGKIEQLLQQFNELLVKLPACTIPLESESEFAAIRRAKADKDMLTLEQLQVRIDRFIDELNSRPRTKRKEDSTTRRKLWESAGAVSKPPIRDLVLFVPEHEERDVSISNWNYKFRSHEQEDDYEPKLTCAEDMYRWMVAVSRKEFVPLRAIKLDDGWKNEICLDRDDGYWCEGILKRQQRVDATDRNEWANSAIKRIKAMPVEWITAIMPEIERMGVDKVYKDQITDKPVRLEEAIAQASAVSTDSSDTASSDLTSQDSPALPPVVKNTSLRIAPPSKAEPVKRKFDPDAIPDIDELMRQAEEGL